MQRSCNIIELVKEWSNCLNCHNIREVYGSVEVGRKNPKKVTGGMMRLRLE